MAPAHEHNCIHGQLEPTETPRRTHQPYGAADIPPEKHAALESSPTTRDADADGKMPLRVFINTDALRVDPGSSCFADGAYVAGQVCHPAQVLTAEKVALLEDELMPRAVAFFSSLLRVTPVAGNLRLGTTHCGFSGGVRVPREYATDGVPDADMVFFVTARPIGVLSGADTIAYSGHCELDQFGRPVAAHFNWSPEHLHAPQVRGTHSFRLATHPMAPSHTRGTLTWLSQ